MRYISCALFLLVTIIGSYASWYEETEVHVVDALNRPIAGALVTVLYQKNNYPITEKTLDGALNLTTNESGKVILSFGNTVQDPVYEARYYILKANYGGQEKSEKILCGGLGSKCHDKLPYIYTFKFNAHRVILKVLDQNGEPLEGADVYFGGQHYKVDKSGMLWVSVLDGTEYKIVVEYMNKKRTLSDKISNEDVTRTVTIPRYDVKLHVVDDYGNPLPSEVMLNGETKKTDDKGYVSFDNIVTDNVEIVLRNANGFREFTLPLYDNVDMDIVFDTTSPSIDQVSKSIDTKQKAIFISASIRDPGSKASGLSMSNPVKLKYSVNNSGWTTVNMYVIGKDAYQATIPLVYDSRIDYEIEAIDTQGNVKTYSNNLFVKSSEVGDSSQSRDQQADTNKQTGGTDIVTLAGGIIVILIVLLIIYKKYTGEI